MSFHSSEKKAATVSTGTGPCVANFAAGESLFVPAVQFAPAVQKEFGAAAEAEFLIPPPLVAPPFPFPSRSSS
jgi:hypothetical protein